MWCLHAKKIFVTLCLWISATGLFAQIGSSDLPVEPTDVYDWRAVRINPAISGLQSGAVEAGYRVFHAGFADAGTSLFKSAYLILNVPRRLPWALSAGLTTSMFSTPILRENEIHLFASKRISPYIALGFSMGSFNINYQPDHFYYEESDNLADPVFKNGSSLWKFDMGLGLTYTPTSSIIVGLGVQHLTRPNISLVGDDIHLNPSLTLGVKFHLDRLSVHTSANVDQVHSGSGTVVQINNSDLGTAQLGIDNNQIWTRGRLNVRGPFSFAYGMYFPINDFAGHGAGSHEVAFVYEFDRQVRKFRLSDDPSDWVEFLPPMPTIQVEPQFIAWAEGVETVDIIHKKIERHVDSKLDSSALSKLTLYDLGIVDSITAGTKTTHFEPHKYSILDTNKSKQKGFIVGETYIKFLDTLAMDLKKYPNKSTVIISPNSSDERLFLIGEYLQEQKNIPDDRFGINLKGGEVELDKPYEAERWQGGEVDPHFEVTFALPREFAVTIFPIDSSMFERQWTFVVENMSQDTVFSQTGNCNQTRKIKWDWTGNDGKIIPYGFYKYYISWVDQAGHLRQSTQRLIYARQQQSEIQIEISRNYPKYDGRADYDRLYLSK